MINKGIIVKVNSVLIIILGIFMLCCVPFSLYHNSKDEAALFFSSLICISTGVSLFYSSRNVSLKIQKREGFLIVFMAWICVSFFSALPYYFSGVFFNITDAIFESVSGLTTTGATILKDIEAVPSGMLFWRSMTQWIGGMGIIVLTIALFPLLGIGGVELFVAESPGPTSDKIHPRIKETAKRLWYIYVGMTLLLTLLLYLFGMNFFDALNHGMTTMATGGFSTKNESIAYFQSHSIQFTIMAFMFLAGINYTIIYYFLRGKFKKAWSSEEFRSYLYIVVVLIIICTIKLYYKNENDLEQAFLDASFQLISIITTTGFVTADYTSWTPSLELMFFILLFIGACAGSTSGGIKIIRHLVFFKNSFLELKRLLHPKAIIRLKIDKKIVAPRIMTHILVFLLLYMMLFIVGSILMTIILSDFNQAFLTSIGAVATCLGNVGPAIAELGPMHNFSEIPFTGKWLLMVLMLLGRLEIFTMLIIFTPYFWRRN